LFQNFLFQFGSHIWRFRGQGRAASVSGGVRGGEIGWGSDRRSSHVSSVRSRFTGANRRLNSWVILKTVRRFARLSFLAHVSDVM
jgi:hypothetical protein